MNLTGRDVEYFVQRTYSGVLFLILLATTTILFTLSTLAMVLRFFGDSLDFILVRFFYPYNDKLSDKHDAESEIAMNWKIEREPDDDAASY